jgi:hypothetical protein
VRDGTVSAASGSARGRAVGLFDIGYTFCRGTAGGSRPLRPLLVIRGEQRSGHKSVKTTMIYTHVLNRGGRGVQSPVDLL